jgi:8-oxo-dGTP pyrophosphatase MutT (NUDIX family)
MTDAAHHGLPRGITRLTACRLAIGDEAWPFAREHETEIAAHWQRRTAENPKFFNGRILLTLRPMLRDGELIGRCVAVDFAAFLFWKETGYPDADVVDVFGSGLIRAADGALMLGRQRPGQLNSGLVYPPSGLLDPRDIGADGRIDIAASVAREVAEETALDAADLTREPGFLLACNGPQASVGVLFRSKLAAEDLQRRMEEGLARDPERELSDIVVVRRRTDAAGLNSADWTRWVIDHLLD